MPCKNCSRLAQDRDDAKAVARDLHAAWTAAKTEGTRLAQEVDAYEANSLYLEGERDDARRSLARLAQERDELVIDVADYRRLAQKAADQANELGYKVAALEREAGRLRTALHHLAGTARREGSRKGGRAAAAKKDRQGHPPELPEAS